MLAEIMHTLEFLIGRLGSRSPRNFDHYLPHMLLLSKILIRPRRILKPKHFINNRMDLPRRNQAVHLLEAIKRINNKIVEEVRVIWPRTQLQNRLESHDDKLLS